VDKIVKILVPAVAFAITRSAVVEDFLALPGYFLSYQSHET
jgi:hypothetical protein